MGGKALIYTLGNSDIIIEKNGEKISFGERKKLFRELTLKARKEIEASGEKAKITGVKQEPPTKGLQYTDPDGKQTRVILPIFPVMLDALKEEFANIKETEYYIFYTNQDDEKYNSQDTLHLAKIIEVFLTKMNVPKNFIHLEKINFNPTDTSKLLERFNEFIRTNSDKLLNFERVFLAMGPGTPQMSIASLLTFVKINKLRIYYVPRNGTPYRLNLLQKIKDKETIDSVLSLTSHYNYSSASILYKNLQSEKEHEDLLDALYYRTSFEFERAFEAIDKYYNKFQNEEVKVLRKELYNLKNREENALMKELYYEFALRILSKQYMDAVGMVFRFQEEILKKAVEKCLGVKIVKREPNSPKELRQSNEGTKENKDSKNEDFHQFKEKIRNNEKLKKYLEKSKKDWEKRAPNRVLYRAILEYAIENPEFCIQGEGEKIKKLIDFDRDLEEKNAHGENLLDLRNSTPFAHGFSGVSEERIKEILNLRPTDLIEKFRTILSGIGIKVEKYEDENFPFNRINKYLERALKKM